jgi:cell division protein FtsL
MMTPVREKQPSSSVAVACMVMVAALATAIAVGHVSRRHDVVRLGYQLSQATERLHELEEEHRQLVLETATLTDPARIRPLAMKLGMAPPAPSQVRAIPAQPGQRVARVEVTE